MGSKIKVAVAFATVILVFAWLTITGFNENMQYYMSIEDLKAMQQTSLDKGLRVKGFLVPGSLVKTPNSLEVTFLIEENGHQLEVHYNKELPDTFKHGSEVLVEGQMTEAGYFDARTLMAKCPSKYDSSDEYYDMQKYDAKSHEIEETD